MMKQYYYNQLKWGFKRTIEWNKYQAKVATQTQNQYFDILFDPSYLGVSKVDSEAFVNIRDLFNLDIDLED